MKTENPYVTRTPVSPALAGLITDAAERLGLDGPSAAQAASQGALMIDSVTMFAFGLPGSGLPGYDTLAVATLDDVRVTTGAQAQIVLHTNMMLGPLSGFTFAANDEGELQLFCGMKQAELDGESLARTFLQLSKVAASMRDELMQIVAPAARPATTAKERA